MKKRNLIIGITIVLVLVAGLVYFHLSSQVTMYSDEHITGNTSGNLLNGGLVCEVKDTIYFSNPYDEGTLYQMDSDLSHMKQIAKDNASYINGAGKYLFYTKRNDKKEIDSDAFMALRSTGLYRLNPKTKNMGNLYDDPTQVAALYGNSVYYQHYDQKKGLELYSVRIDGSEEKRLLEEACAPYVITDDAIYYTGMKSDHAIHKISIQGGSSEVIYDGNFTGLSRQGNYLYFLDMNEDYALKRIALDGTQAETLVSEHVATYNVAEEEDILYCQIDNQKDNGLYELDITSHSLNLLEAGNFNFLHLTSGYLFYETYDQSDMFVMDLTTGNREKLPYNK